MKILHVTDLHYQKKQFEWVAQNANQYDVVCISGDFCSIWHEEPLEDQIQWIKEWLERLPRDVDFIICSGNHDVDVRGEDTVNWLKNLKRPNITSDGNSKQIGALTFYSIGWDEAPEPSKLEDVDIIVCHTPPGECMCAVQPNGEIWGDPIIESFLEYELTRARLYLCGHVHEPKKSKCTLGKTTISNPGFTQKNTPKYANFVI
jgi:Icc-related predicted phosphoesterase